MKTFFSTVALFVALVVPSTVSSQRHADHENQEDVVYTTVVQQATAGTTPTSSFPSAEATTATTLQISQSPSPSFSSASSSSSTSPSPSQTSSVSSNPSSTTSTNSTCTGTGMTIAWTGDSVPFSWSGGTGTTTGCTTLGTSFAGQISVGEGTGGGTIFEGNYNTGAMYFDVSFITGFSVPMLCSNSAGDKSGCSIDLFTLGNACPQLSADGKVCTNPVGMNGNKQPGAYGGVMAAEPWCYACSAPDPFFQPCAGAGYTFPYDDGATQAAEGTITCCVGTGCGKTGREGSTKNGHAEPERSAEPCQLCASGGSKRGLLDDGLGLGVSKVSKHRRSGHRHGWVHGGKGMR